jgi:hypothetical protein
MGQASQLGQQGSDHGQYGQTPMASPFGMDSMANANIQQNENTQNAGDYNPVLPSNTLTQGQAKQWYPGIYPNTQPQFGTNPYAPQTANIQGHPGHNPSTIANVEPNMHNSAFSDQGQFVQKMATGGTSTPYTAGNFKYTDPAQKWAGPVNVSSGSQNTPNDVVNAFGKGASAPAPTSSSSAKGGAFVPTPTPSGSAKGIGSAATDPAFTALGKGPKTPVPAPAPAPTPTPATPTHVYTPTYAAYTPARTNIDSYGNPLFNNGGLMDIRK